MNPEILDRSLIVVKLKKKGEPTLTTEIPQSPYFRDYVNVLRNTKSSHTDLIYTPRVLLETFSTEVYQPPTLD